MIDPSARVFREPALFIISAFLVGVACSKVMSDQETRDLAATLSWSSVGADHMALMLIPKPIGPAAERLVAIGKDSTPALLRVLQDPERAVAAHLILCSIWHSGQLESREESLYQGKEIVGFRHTVFGLTWTVNFRYPPDAPPPPSEDDPFDIAKLGERSKWARSEYSVAAEDLASNFAAWCAQLPRRYRGACS